MTSVGCVHMPSQRNKGLVLKHVIKHSKNEKITLKKYMLSVFILHKSVSMDRMSILSLPSCFSGQDASNGTHDDLTEPTLRSDPGHGQGHYITMNFIMCGVTPLKWAVLPECYQFSENVLYVVAS